jgi:hypothetical protein
MIKTILLSLSLAALAVCFSNDALAAATPESNCTVTTVGYSHGYLTGTGNHRFIYVVCSNNTVHIAYASAGNSGCPTVDTDSLKIWHNVALAAKLSGRPITIWWEPRTCAGTTSKRMISGIE